MRIDQMNMPQSISTTGNTSRSGQTEVSQPVKQPTPVERPKQQDTSSLRNQEQQHLEAEIAAEKRAAEKEHEVIQAITKANKHIKTYDRRLEFAIHDTTKQIMVKVLDTNDNSVIREIPSEKVLDMVAHLWEVAGILVDEHR